MLTKSVLTTLALGVLVTPVAAGTCTDGAGGDTLHTQEACEAGGGTWQAGNTPAPTADSSKLQQCSEAWTKEDPDVEPCKELCELSGKDTEQVCEATAFVTGTETVQPCQWIKPDKLWSARDPYCHTLAEPTAPKLNVVRGVLAGLCGVAAVCVVVYGVWCVWKSCKCFGDNCCPDTKNPDQHARTEGRRARTQAYPRTDGTVTLDVESVSSQPSELDNSEVTKTEDSNVTLTLVDL